jgi:uncharacterized membrane protein YhhN
MISVGTAVCLVALVVAEKHHSQLGKWLFKPLASTGFVAVALAGGALHGSYGRAILVALMLSWVGDVLLIPGSRATFVAGLASFLVGHAAFAIAFVIRGVAWPAAAAALVLMSALAIFVGRWLLPHVDGRMRGPVVAYITVIAVMASLAVGTQRPLLVAAAVAFFVSDLSVARDRFVAPGFVNRAWGLPLYYFAQLLFAYSVRALSP